MSEFTPLPKNNPAVTSSANTAADLSAHSMVGNAKKPNARALGWSFSIGLHVLACSLLLTGLSSALRLNTLPGSAEMAAADPASAQARQQVQQLLQTQQELERIQASTQANYEHWLHTQASHAAANVQQAVRTAGEAHAQAEQALQQADAAQSAIAQARQALTTAVGQDMRTRALNSLQQAHGDFAKAQDAVQRAQERAGEAYAEASRNMEFLPEGSGDIQAVRQAIAAAIAARTQAHDAQLRTAAALNALQSQENGPAETVRAMAEGPRQTANAQKAQALAQQQAEQAGRAAQQLQTFAAQAQSQAALATAREAQTHTPADSQSARKAQQESASLSARALKAQQEAQNLQAQAQAAQNAAAKAVQTAAQQQNDLQQKLKAGEQAAQQLAQAQRDALLAQSQARQQHTAAASAVRQLRTVSRQPAGESATDPTVDGTQDSAAFDAKHRNSLHSFEILNSQDLAQLYDTATRTEAANLLTAQQIQARAASMAQTIPLQQALDATDATPPVRPQLGNQGHPSMSLFAGASEMTTRQREEARQQIASMNALAQQMLNRAQTAQNAKDTAQSKRSSQSSSQGTPVATATMSASTTPSAQQIALATEDDIRPAKDLTGTAFSPPGLPGQEKTHAPKADHSEKSEMPQGANIRGEAPPPSPPVEIKALPGRIVGKDVNGRGLAGKSIIGEKDSGSKAEESGATGADWMYVDSWYTIGPFPNPQRQNIHKPFPPESGVDLDAVYVGKDNRTVRWQWIQTGKPELVPNIPEEYAIYYGYTELWFEEPADLWIALGSDDKSTLWIEDQLVWVSSDILKGWRIDEGLRKIHFKQGRNRVLFRLENGWRGVGFSLCLCLKPNPR